MIVRRDRHQELGGFDETFFMEWEDLDLCWRASLRGWETVYVPDACVRHHVGASTGRSERSRRSAASHHNLLRFALKCLPADAACRVAAGELLRLARHPGAVTRGIANVVTELREIVALRRALHPKRQVFEELLTL
jgi:GT2 family glycosyltransferase